MNIRTILREELDKIDINTYTLYRGTNNKEDFLRNPFTFLAKERYFAEDYYIKGQGFLYEVEIKLPKIFDVLKDLTKLIQNGWEFYDAYDDKTWDINNWDEYNFSDTWDIIENTDGLLQAIESSGYDAIMMNEGGSDITFYVFNPKEKIVSYKQID